MTLVVVTVSTSMTLLAPRSLATEGGSGGSGGSEGGGSTGGGTSGGESGGGTAGAYSGHETVKMTAIVDYMLKYVYTSLPVMPTPSQFSPLTSIEKQFLCSMGRLRLYDSYSRKIWFPTYLAQILGRPFDVVADAMEWTSCPSQRR